MGDRIKKGFGQGKSRAVLSEDKRGHLRRPENLVVTGCTV